MIRVGLLASADDGWLASALDWAASWLACHLRRSAFDMAFEFARCPQYFGSCFGRFEHDRIAGKLEDLCDQPVHAAVGQINQD